MRIIFIVLAVLLQLSEGGKYLDPHFGDRGMGMTTTQIEARSYGNSVAIQNDRKIVVAGRTQSHGTIDFALARYESNGTLDTSFNFDGKAFTQVGYGNSEARDIAIIGYGNSKIFVAGESMDENGTSYFTLLQYNEYGLPDINFGDSGTVMTKVSGNHHCLAASVDIQFDHGDSELKPIVAGWCLADQNIFAMTRYESNGTLDSDFGENHNGIVTTTVSSKDGRITNMAIYGDSRIALTGCAGGGSVDSFLLMRYEENGTLDLSFDIDGITTMIVSYEGSCAEDLAIQRDGKVVAAGFCFIDGERNIALVRYNEDGSPDESFGDRGIVITRRKGSRDIATNVALLRDGKIVISGTSNGDFFVARYLTNGKPDTSFGENGMMIESIQNDGVYQGMFLQDDGKAVVVGTSDLSATDTAFIVMRFMEETPRVPAPPMAPIYYLLQ
jgi:uncharacterized delta-60 repeat protein